MRGQVWEAAEETNGWSTTCSNNRWFFFLLSCVHLSTLPISTIKYTQAFLQCNSRSRYEWSREIGERIGSKWRGNVCLMNLQYHPSFNVFFSQIVRSSHSGRIVESTGYFLLLQSLGRLLCEWRPRKPIPDLVLFFFSSRTFVRFYFYSKNWNCAVHLVVETCSWLAKQLPGRYTVTIDTHSHTHTKVPTSMSCVCSI